MGTVRRRSGNSGQRAYYTRGRVCRPRIHTIGRAGDRCRRIGGRNNRWRGVGGARGFR